MKLETEVKIYQLKGKYYIGICQAHSLSKWKGEEFEDQERKKIIILWNGQVEKTYATLNWYPFDL